MSWGTCYSGSNNIYHDFPPIMHDGRNYSSWQPGASLNEHIKKQVLDYLKQQQSSADGLIRCIQASR